jgi:hypothetical protein
MPLKLSPRTGVRAMVANRCAQSGAWSSFGEEKMGLKWTLHGREFSNCNCAYGCPCQFNALPTHGNCAAVVGIQVDSGHHGDTPLDGLRIAAVLRWPGAIHEGGGEVFPIVDRRADPAQREALLRIMSGQDTAPGATIFNVFSATFVKMHEPLFSEIEFEVDVDKRRARLSIPGHVDLRGEPIINPVTGKEFRARIDIPDGFEYTLAEMGRGWSKTTGPIALEFNDTYGQFAQLHLCQDGIVR